MESSDTDILDIEINDDLLTELAALLLPQDEEHDPNQPQDSLHSLMQTASIFFLGYFLNSLVGLGLSAFETVNNAEEGQLYASLATIIGMMGWLPTIFASVNQAIPTVVSSVRGRIKLLTKIIDELDERDEATEITASDTTLTVDAWRRALQNDVNKQRFSMQQLYWSGHYATPLLAILPIAAQLSSYKFFDWLDNHNGDADITLNYFRIAAGGILFYSYSVMLNSFGNGLDHSNRMTLIKFIASLVGGALGHFLTVGIFDKRLGFVGMSVGVSCASFLSAVFMEAYFFCSHIFNKEIRRYGLYSWRQGGMLPNKMLREIFKLGGPTAAFIASDVGFFVAQTIMAIRKGDQALRILTALQFPFQLTTIFFFATGGAAEAHVGEKIGEQKYADMRRVFAGFQSMALLLATLFSLVMFFIPAKVLASFTIDMSLTDNIDCLPVLTFCFYLLGIMEFLEALRIQPSYHFISMKDPNLMAIFQIATTWLIGFPACLYFTSDSGIDTLAGMMEAMGFESLPDALMPVTSVAGLMFGRLIGAIPAVLSIWTAALYTQNRYGDMTSMEIPGRLLRWLSSPCRRRGERVRLLGDNENASSDPRINFANGGRRKPGFFQCQADRPDQNIQNNERNRFVASCGIL